MLRILLIAAAAAGLSACATDGQQGADAGNRDCFHAEQVSGYSVIDDHHIGVRVGASRNYVLETDWNARDLDWGNAIAIRSDSSWICSGDNLGVRVIGGDPVRTYWIRSVARAAEAPAQGE